MGYPEGNLPVQLESGVIAAVNYFIYLGSLITNNGETIRRIS